MTPEHAKIEAFLQTIINRKSRKSGGSVVLGLQIKRRKRDRFKESRLTAIFYWVWCCGLAIC